MTIRKICVDEVTDVTASYSETVTCTNPAHSPVAAGDECNVHLYNVGLNLGVTPPTLSFSFDSQFEYIYHQPNCATFNDFCDVWGRSGSVNLPNGVTLCCEGSISPEITSSITCHTGPIVVGSNSVSGPVAVSFTVSDLCCPTIICVDDTTCP